MNSTTSFTFLATLFVLFLISASIIFRSFLIRRRFRQRVEGALAQGVFLDLQPSGFGFSTRFIGEKPKVHEAWVKQSVLREKITSKIAWQNIMPVAVRLTRSAERKELQLPHDPPPQRPSFLARLKRHSETTESHPPTNTLEPSPDDTVCVCVLISMPHPDSPAHFRHSAASFEDNQQNFALPTTKTTDEEGVPNVVFGTAELAMLGAWTDTKRES